MQELSVSWVLFERSDWDAIINLIAKRINCVINNQYVLKLYVLENSKVLYINVLMKYAVRSKESMLDQISFWIKVINNNICVLFIACSKNCNFEVLICSLKHLLCIRPNVKSYTAYNSSRISYIKKYVWGSFWLWLADTM